MDRSKTLLDFEQLLRVPYVNPETGFDVSPDGKQVAFSWNVGGQWEIYLLDLEARGAPRPLTHGPGAKFRPRFSPDGKRLLYALDLDGGEAFDIYLCELESGEHRSLTPDTPESILPEFCWSPAGEEIAFISDASGAYCTCLLDLQGQNAAPRLVFEGGGPNVRVDWSPDGKYLAVEFENRGQDFAIQVVPLEQAPGSRRAKLLSQDGKTLNAWQACWSPDGGRLAFSSEWRGRYEIGLYDLDSAEIAWVASAEGDLGEPDWSPDGWTLAYIWSEGPDTWLVVHDLETGRAERFQVAPGVHYSPRFSANGRSILLVFDNPRRPDDLWRFDLETKTFEQLTHSMPPGIDPEALVMPRHVGYPSLDGRHTPALLYVPPGLEKPAPAVLVIHGGPNWLFQYLWYPLMSYMVSRGWVVLAPNYRGSTGYGRAWQVANRFEMGRGDTMDVAAGVDYLLRQGLADPQRIAVTGRSHGGYLTMSCLTEYPERWAAGSAVVPFLNWFTSHAHSRKDLQHWDIENMGDPHENEALWRERSPFFHLERVTAPVQLISGANDPRCPASESLAARDRLLALGKEVELLLYPDEGHAFLKIENVIDHEVKRVEFLRKRLEG